MMLLPFVPNWDTPPLERLEWLTEVLLAKDDTEECNQLRTGARRTFEFSILLLSDAERVRFENILLAWQQQSIFVPYWVDATWLTSAAGSTDTTLAVESTHAREFFAGQQIAIVNDLAWVIATVDTVASNAIFLTAPLGAALPVGARVAPLFEARTLDTQPLTYITDNQLSADLSFRFKKEWIGTPATETADYRGLPVMHMRNEWSEDLSAEVSRAIAEFDTKSGVVDFFDLTGVSRAQRSHRWKLFSRDEISVLKSWLAKRKGRLNEFWLPTYQTDFKVRANISAAATTIAVDNWAHSEVTAQIGRRDLMIKTKSGAYFYRRITNVVSNSAVQETITINASLGIAIAVTDIECICYLRLMRLASDTVEISYDTDEHATLALSLTAKRDVA